MSENAWDAEWGEWAWAPEIELEQIARRILGVGPKAGLKEIKAAYRSLAFRFHPDTDPSDATLEAKFRVIAEAYEILTSGRNKGSRHLMRFRS